MFQLHPQLKKDSFFIKNLELCQVLLMNNAFYPWLILVPRKEGLVEIIDLSFQEQNLLMAEISSMSKILKNDVGADKINIATFGNVVPQLHIHIIARFKNDLTFPKPVWVSQDIKEYQNDDKEKLINLVKQKEG